MTEVVQQDGHERQPIGDLLALIQNLTTRVIRAESVADLFVRGFRTLFEVVSYDIAVAVTLEQNLDLYIVCRSSAQSMVGEPLIDRIRAALETLTNVSFASTDVVVKGEANDLPASAAPGESLTVSVQSVLEQDGRLTGMLLLFRAEPPFDREQEQVLAIFSAQMSMLIGNIRAREQILNLADTDDLTGIWNKRYFRRQLLLEIERARVYSVPLSLLIFDVDDFKQINDGFGHTMGDVVLSELCGAVRETLRQPDSFARFGGDEFAVILPHTDLAGAAAAAERILSRVRTLAIPTDEEGTIQCSISIGVADYIHGDSANDLVRRSDERLYVAKRNGKNQCNIAPPA